MGKGQKRAGVFLSYVNVAANFMVHLLYTPLMLRLLGQSEYGIYTFANSTISFLSVFDLGFAETYLRYWAVYAANNDKKKIEILNGTYLKLFSLLGLIASTCGVILALNVNVFFSRRFSLSELHTTKVLMILLSIDMGVTLFSSVFSSIINSQERFIWLKALQLIKTICSPFIAIPLMLSGLGSVGVVLSVIIISIFTIVCHIFYCIKVLHTKFDLHITDFKLIKSMSKFSAFIFLNEIISQINWNVDKVLLGMYQGTKAVAVYGVGSQIDVLYREVSGSISSVFAPQINDMVVRGESDDELTNLFIRVGRIQLLVLSPVLIGFYTFGQYFIRIWSGEGYNESYWVAVLLITPVTIPLIQNIGIEIQRAKNKHQFRSIIYFVMAILNIFVSIPLCIKWGAIGSAFGTSLSLLVGNGFIMNWYYQTHLGINVIKFWKDVLKFSLSLIAPITFGIVITRFVMQWSILRFIVLGIIYILVYCLSVWKLGMNVEEKKLVKSLLKTFQREKL